MNILFIAPHLSTGGMPEFLYKRVEVLLNNNHSVSVIEYSNYSDEYSTHKNRIKSLLGTNFYTLGGCTNNLNELNRKTDSIKQIVRNGNFDIIHIEDIIEGFDDFNNIHSELIEFLYSNNRTWRVIESPHDNFTSLNDKKFNPDGYSLCSEYQQNHLFNNINNSSVINYPIIDRKISYELIDKEQYNILSVGIWSPGKNHNHTIELARKLNDIYPNKYIFNFAGSMASNFSYYWQGIQDNLPSNCKILGEVSDIESLYKDMDMVYFNSLNECDPIALKETISFGLRAMVRPLNNYPNIYKKIFTDIVDDNDVNLEAFLKTLHSFDQFYNFYYETDNDFYLKLNNFYKDIKSNDIVNNNFSESLRCTINISYIDGIKVSIDGFKDNYTYNVSFIDLDTDVTIFKSDIKIGEWCKPSIEYIMNWRIYITSNNPNFDDVIYDYDLNNKNIFIEFESSSLGDTLAWVSVIEQYSKTVNSNIFIKTFRNELFQNIGNIHFVDKVSGFDVKVKIGAFSDENGNYIKSLNKNNWNSISLFQIASDTLNFNNYIEEAPKSLKKINKDRPINDKYVLIATESTAQCKYWNRTNGWEELVEQLENMGYKVYNTSLNNNKNFNNIPSYDMETTMNWIQHCEFFIGLTSGLSWLSWALNKQCFMITGISNDILEFKTNNIRIEPPQGTCKGCWNRSNFDRSNWNWCPDNSGTYREFECTKNISPDIVLNKIKQYLKK